MAANQTSYSDVIVAGTPGMVANSEPTNIISRTLSGSDLAFGLPVLRGSTDHACILAAQEALQGAFTADAGNTGNGAMGAITVATGSKVGNYRLVVIEPATNAGVFVLEDPDGIEVGQGTIGSAFSGGGLGFTWADGATDFVSGDGGVIAVTPTSDLGDLLGISVRDTTLGAAVDVYKAGDNVAILDEGVIWVTAGATVTPNDKPYWNPATSRFTKTSTHLEIKGATFETSGANGDLVKLKLRKTAPR